MCSRHIQGSVVFVGQMKQQFAIEKDVPLGKRSQGAASQFEPKVLSNNTDECERELLK